MGFAGYFLIVADFIKWAKENGIPVGPGRGSGAGSLVAWSLTITDLDPIKLGCCSNASSTPNASRCRTSTSTSAKPGAAR
jgi:DNA polymerase III alpha subunit (gram-positive type)